MIGRSEASTEALTEKLDDSCMRRLLRRRVWKVADIVVTCGEESESVAKPNRRTTREVIISSRLHGIQKRIKAFCQLAGEPRQCFRRLPVEGMGSAPQRHGQGR